MTTAFHPSHVTPFMKPVSQSTRCSTNHRRTPGSNRTASSRATTSWSIPPNSQVAMTPPMTQTLSENPVGVDGSTRPASHEALRREAQPEPSDGRQNRQAVRHADTPFASGARESRADETEQDQDEEPEARPARDTGDPLPGRAGEQAEEREPRSPDDGAEHVEGDEAPVRDPGHPREPGHQHAERSREPSDEHGTWATAADVVLCPIEILVERPPDDRQGPQRAVEQGSPPPFADGIADAVPIAAPSTAAMITAHSGTLP
jgi:hypothetical protein